MERSARKDQRPHEARRSRAQIRGILALLGSRPRRVLDLGCGEGRLLVPLVRAGHRVMGIDRDPAALARCAKRLGRDRARATLLEQDFNDSWLRQPKRFHLICCLGNTFMTIADFDDAVRLLRRVARRLSPAGAFIIDDFPFELRAEVTEGYWQTGLSEDGRSQLVWQPGDDVLAIRRGQDIDMDSWVPKPQDQLLRLWTMGALRLLAQAARLSPPEHCAKAGLILLGGTALRAVKGGAALRAV